MQEILWRTSYYIPCPETSQWKITITQQRHDFWWPRLFRNQVWGYLTRQGIIITQVFVEGKENMELVEEGNYKYHLLTIWPVAETGTVIFRSTSYFGMNIFVYKLTNSFFLFMLFPHFHVTNINVLILPTLYFNTEVTRYKNKSVTQKRNEHHPKMDKGTSYLLLRRGLAYLWYT